MAVGKVKWFNGRKGFGFITPDKEGEQDVFLHISALQKAQISHLDEGQTISYELETRSDGRSTAINIAIQEDTDKGSSEE